MAEHKTQATEEVPRWRGGQRVLDIRVDDVTLSEAMSTIVNAARVGTPCHIITLNPEYVMRARRDAELRAIIASAAIVTADGAGIMQAARLARMPLRARITGNDLTDAVAEAGLPLFLLGAAPGVAEAAAAVLTRRYPSARIAGFWSGSADADDDAAARARINASGARVVLVAYGMPKQDHWIDRNLPSLQAPVAIGVGGTFDYLAGRIPRAPHWMRTRGLEWLYRLARQPSRFPRILRVWQFGAVALFSARAERRRDGKT
ncbi:MAG: WecB/TagA/CpsF family glycosyltransferase [Chloroflexota bacterium]|nr:WecB/TagA/CpsF family glycosyltransferase [Chloroflexota bacterium]